jgi:hypothetical protein
MYILNLEFIPESKDYFKPQTINEVIKLFEIRAKKNPPLTIKLSDVIEMFTELKSIEFKKLTPSKKSPYNVQLNNEKLLIESVENVYEEKYSSNLYELGFINKYSVIELINQVKHTFNTNSNSYGDNFKSFIIQIIENYIIDDIYKYNKLDKKQKSLFPKKEKEYNKSRLMYKTHEIAQKLYSNDAWEMLENVENFKTQSNTVSNNTLSHFVSEIEEKLDIHIDDDISPIDVVMKKYKFSKFYGLPNVYVFQ